MDGKVKTKHGELSLEELAALAPGMSELMVGIGQRMQAMYHACREGNWRLGAYQCRAIRKLFETSKVTRPRYAEAVHEFLEQHVRPIEDSLRAEDWKAFAAALARAISASDEYHKQFGYGYIRYQISDEPGRSYRLIL